MQLNQTLTQEYFEVPKSPNNLKQKQIIKQSGLLEAFENTIDKIMTNQTPLNNIYESAADNIMQY